MCHTGLPGDYDCNLDQDITVALLPCAAHELHTRLLSSTAASWLGFYEVDGAAAKKRPMLSVRPSSGVLAAHSRLALTAIFAPRVEAPLNASVLCSVRRMSRPLALNVKGEGYALRDSMQARACKRKEQVAEKVNDFLKFVCISVL